MAMVRPGSAESGEYASLSPDAPGAPVRAREGHAAGFRPRALSQKQRGTLLGIAAKRVAEESRERRRRWLRRLDTVHASGCRTKQQRWDALAAMIEPMLARVDLATLALGWLDDAGVFRLNRQRGLAEDGGLAECRASRTLTALERAGYIRRKVRRIFKHGLHWVCRVTIHLRPRFFIDLGLGGMLAEARTKAKSRRDSRLREIGVRTQRAALDELAAAEQRKRSHRRAKAVREERVVQLEHARAVQSERDRAERLQSLMIDHPEASLTELRAMLDGTSPSS